MRPRKSSGSNNQRPPAPVLIDNTHFSDSASSHEGGSEDESHQGFGAVVAGPEVPGRGGVGGGGRRRRSGGIPSLISRQGSRSSLRIDDGISRVHEINRWVGM